MWLATGGRGQNENSGLLLRGCENIDLVILNVKCEERVTYGVTEGESNQDHEKD